MAGLTQRNLLIIAARRDQRGRAGAARRDPAAAAPLGVVAGTMRQNREAIKALYGSDRVMNRGELPWVKIKKPTVHYPVIK